MRTFDTDDWFETTLIKFTLKTPIEKLFYYKAKISHIWF